MARVCCVTLHAVIDDTFTCRGFAVGRTQRAQTATSYPVGKGVSCAAAVASLGHAASCAVFVLCGTSDTDVYREMLEARGYQAVCVMGGPERTRRHVTVIDPESDSAVTHVQVQGIPHPPALFGEGGPVTEAVVGLAGPGSVVALSGSLPTGAPADYYAALVKAVHTHGAKAVLDTSGEALELGLRAAPFATKPNRAEAEALLGRPIGAGAANLAKAAREIIDRFGLTWVLLSDGKEGLVVAGPLGAHHGRVELDGASAARVVNDQGCGDSVVAAFAAAASAPGGITDARALVRDLVAAGTANLFSDRPGELPPDELAALKDGRIPVVVAALD